MRKIIHIDMDAFFAAVEIRDNPKYKGLPIVIGSLKKRGVVATCSYEAREYGIHSAMSCIRAKKLCPDAIFLDYEFDKYRLASAQMNEVLEEFTDKIEPASIDEAFLDVTENANPSATLIAKKIKERIYQKTGLIASAGVSFNKFLAKIASKMEKPDGLTVIEPHEAKLFLNELKIEDFFGIGQVTAKKMKYLGIYNGKDLKSFSLQDLTLHFGKIGAFYYNIVRGQDDRPIINNRVQKSLGKENTFAEDIWHIDKMLLELKKLSIIISDKLILEKIKGKTVTLKVKYADFTIMSRSITMFWQVQSSDEIFGIVKKLLKNNLIESKKVRLLGVSISNLSIGGSKILVYEQVLLSFLESSRL